MTDPYIVTEFSTGLEFSKYMKYIKQQYTWDNSPFGYMIENASSDPKVTAIDKNENPFTADSNFYSNNELLLWTKCLMSEDGVQTDGKDYIGSNLDRTGASGDVMTYIPNGQYSYKWEEDADVQIFKFAPYFSNHRGFDYHPNCYQGGGTKHDHFYWGTYKAGLKDDAGTLKFNSCAGVQPWTGGAMKYLSFTSGGTTAFTVGETLTNAVTGATGIVVSYHLTSGSWAGGNAAGVVYIRQTTGTSGAGQLNGSIAGVDCATASGASSTIYLTLYNALTYARNKGTGWEITGIYDLSWIQGLLYAQWLTRNSQAAAGKGYTELPVGTGYAGPMNGENDIDLNLDARGNGSGDGLNGQTSIEVNNICDLFGGSWTFVSGINIYANGSYKLTKPDGTGTISATLGDGHYIDGVGTLPVGSNDYIATVKRDKFGAITWMPDVVGGANSGNLKGFCDMWNYTTSDPSTMLYGGYWNSMSNAGISCRNAASAISNSYDSIGARLKYIPQS